MAYTGVYMYNYCKEINFQNIKIKWECNHLSLSKNGQCCTLTCNCRASTHIN